LTLLFEEVAGLEDRGDDVFQARDRSFDAARVVKNIPEVVLGLATSGSCCPAIARSAAAANNGSGSSRMDVDIANSSMRSQPLNGSAPNASPGQAFDTEHLWRLAAVQGIL
jgi:hypothetical protein